MHHASCESRPSLTKPDCVCWARAAAVNAASISAMHSVRCFLAMLLMHGPLRPPPQLLLRPSLHLLRLL